MKISKTFFQILIIISIFFLPKITFAEEYVYKVLTPLSGIANNAGEAVTLKDYIPAVFNLLIGVAAVFAVVMIVYGGFQYMTTDALQGKQEGKERIKNAIMGLIMVIAAALILMEINPNLLTFNLNLESITTTSTSGGSLSSGSSSGSSTSSGTKMTDEEIAASNAVRKTLSDKGVYTYADPCTNGQISVCVNLNGLNSTLESGLIAFNKMCDSSGTDCNVLITGGTEPGAHSVGSVHYTGKAVDLAKGSATLNNYIKSNGIASTVTYNNKTYTKYTLNVNGQTMNFLDEDSKHWHVSIP